MALTSQRGAPRWARHQGAGGSCVAFRREGLHLGPGASLHLKMLLPGRPGGQAGRRGLRVETAWLAEAALAPGHWWQCSSENVFSCLSTVPANSPLPPNITSPCLALSGGGESLSTDVMLRSGRPWRSLGSAAWGRAALEGAALLCRALFFFHVGEKNPGVSHSTDPKGQIFAVCPAFSISGGGGGNAWLLGRTREAPAGRGTGHHPSASPKALQPGPRSVMGDHRQVSWRLEETHRRAA